MVRFLDGPANGAVLDIARAPVMLRLVRSPSGEWDALDQLDDQPKPGETIVVYRIEGNTGGFVHTDGRDRQGRRRSWTSALATYRFWPEQPTGDQMRTTGAWQAWCAALQAREAATSPPT